MDDIKDIILVVGFLIVFFFIAATVGIMIDSATNKEGACTRACKRYDRFINNEFLGVSCSKKVASGYDDCYNFCQEEYGEPQQ